MADEKKAAADQDMKGILKDMFDSVSSGYDGEALRFFPRTAGHLPGLLELKGDELVLDVACGTGHGTLEIAPKLPEGGITAVDLSPGMLNQARRKAGERGIGNVRFLERDMQDLDFPEASFDVAVCTFGIFFVMDMEAQLSHIASKVKPGGKVLITSFQGDYFQPLRDLFFRRITSYGAPEPPGAWKGVAEEDACRRLFEQAGLTNVQVVKKNVGYHLKDGEEWWEIVWNAGFRRFVTALPSGNRERFRLEHLEEVGRLRTGDGIWLDAGVLYTLGKRPA